jgi:2-octaprenyl-6-methoxyphenol hydroxylase
MNRVAIVGGGPAGMALALALKMNGVSAEIFEARPRSTVQHDARTLALSDGARQMLDALGVWSQIAATAIQTIHVSHRGGLGRTRLSAEEMKLPSLGWVLSASSLIRALDHAIADHAIPYHEGAKIAPGAMEGYALTAWAEGAMTAADGKARDYGQHAVLCNVKIAEPHRNVAWERFTPDGPVALLPLHDEYAVVLIVKETDVARVKSLDDTAFLALLQHRFGERHRFTAASPRLSYPLGLRYREQPVGQREVWLGNAAQTLHPVAGQGFNLALRDIWELATHLGKANDVGDPRTLAAYAAGRKLDRRGAITFTNILIDAFATDFPPLLHLRGAGLLALDLFPPLRNFVAKRMIYGARAWP